MKIEDLRVPSAGMAVVPIEGAGRMEVRA